MNDQFNYPQTLFLNTTYNLSLTYSDQNNNPINLTGYSAIFAAGYCNQSDTINNTAVNNCSVTLGGAAGTIVVTMTAAQTAALESLFTGQTCDKINFNYSLTITDTLGNVTPLLAGILTVSNKVRA